VGSGIAGVYDPEGVSDASAMQSAFEPWERAAVVTAGPLVAARAAPDAPAHDAERVVCLLAGRIHNLARVAQELECPADLPAEQVLATGYARRGEDLLGLLRGSFAVLLWDRDEQQGIVAQDQVTNRTVYYSSTGAGVSFASDIAPLLRLLPRRPQPDTVALVHWIANSSPPEPLTLYEGVLKVGFGRLLRLGPDGWELARYWSPTYRRPAQQSRDEVVATLWTRLVDAVAVRSPASDRMGIVMSGGIDSAAVAAAATAHARGAVRGYSAVFPGRERLDESERIDVLSAALDLPSVQIEPGPGGSYALALEYLRRWDLPLVGAGYVLERPLLEQAAADGVTALLDGQGGDELFGFSPYLLGDRIHRGRLVSSLRLARAFPNLGVRPPWRHTLHLWNRFGLRSALPYSVHEAARRLKPRVPHYLTKESAALVLDTETRWLWRQNPQGPLWWSWKAALLTREREEVGLPEYLRHRAAMTGLDARLPLMDLDLVEASLAVPPDYDFDSRFDRPLVREAMKDLVPDEIRLSPSKSNLAPYYHEGVAEHDFPLFRDLLLARDAEILRYVDGTFVRRLLERAPRVGERGWIMWLAPVWALVTAETWLRHQADPSFVEERLARGPVRPSSRLWKAPG
jgi:asparagine synthase (glutamine-hydrolysing)